MIGALHAVCTGFGLFLLLKITYMEQKISYLDVTKVALVSKEPQGA